MQQIEGIDKIICVASGKGGVGKSTIAVNLACALAKLGKSVGLLDADLYGPSVPHLLGINETPKLAENNKIKPIKKFGILSMSIGLLVPVGSALIWRGPLIQKAMTQLLFDVDWGKLDILIIDMPPGTGDPYLTLAKKVLITGALIVSTPQELALLDVRKGVAMFEKMGVPIFGFVENMHGFTCHNCQTYHQIFGQQGIEKATTNIHYPTLARIPMDADLNKSCDTSHPLVMNEYETSTTKDFFALANTVDNLAQQASQRRNLRA